MAIPVGGLRARLIRDSVYNTIYNGLDALGWFDDGRSHRAITFTGTEVDQAEEIQLNTISLSDEDLFDSEAELGSNLTETLWTYYLDFFAEDNDIGKHLVNDVRDILGGRMSSIGRTHPFVIVYDYSQATPPPLFKVWIEEIVVDRAHDYPKPWLKHWYAVRFTVLDTYGDESTEEYDPEF